MDHDTIDLKNVSLDDDNVDEDNLASTVLVRLMAWCNTFKQRKACKEEKSMYMVKTCMSEDGKKKKKK